MAYLRTVAIVLWKDARSEFRTREMLGSMLIFSLLVVVIFSFALDPTRKEMLRLFPGLLWVTFFFSGLLGLNRSFLKERHDESIQGLMLCPVDRSALFFGKFLGNLLFMGVVEAVTLPVFLVFFDFPYRGSVPGLALALILGTVGFSAVGTLLAAMSANTRSSEVLLPVLLFPVAVPVVIGSVQLTAALVAGEPVGIGSTWVKLLAVYDLVFLVTPLLLFEYLLEA